LGREIGGVHLKGLTVKLLSALEILAFVKLDRFLIEFRRVRHQNL
jgi:hypothetical protein